MTNGFSLERFKNISKVSFNCEVITPMFLGGANPKNTELREASFKGVLRFWWRALHYFYACKKNNNDFTKLREKEFILFGNTKNKSMVALKINQSGKIQSDLYSPLPHKNVSFKSRGISPKQKFNINIYSPKEIVSLFILITVLGGFGKRARRGFGSIEIINCSKEKDITKKIKELLPLIGLKENKHWKFKKNKIVFEQKNSDCRYPFIKSIEIGKKGYNDYNSLLKIIGKSSHDNNSDCTGFAKGRGKRLSSPIYVSIARGSDDKYYPVVTTLNIAYRYNLNCSQAMQKFKQDILRGEA